MLHPPKFQTKRDLTFPTRGHLAGAFGRLWLGRPFMPWQQLVADVTGEYDPDTLLPRYTLCLITVQRQAGKSHLSMAQNGERCLSVPGYKAWYTAQTGGDARDQFLKFQDDIVDGTPLDGLVRTLRGRGTEHMIFPNRSQIRPHPPTPGALHGKQVDRDDIDEGWYFSKDQGKALLQAASPAKLTRPGAQTFIWSAGGTSSSTWLAELVARGREGDPSLCYFEFGIPDDLDVNDLQAMAEHHPAFRHPEANPHGTITAEAMASMRTDIPDDDEYARAGGNRWSGVIGGGVQLGVWEDVRTTLDIPDSADVTYGAARAGDGTHVVLAAAAVLDGVCIVEVVDVMPAHRAARRISEFTDGDVVACARTGPSGPLFDELERTRARVVPMSVSAEAAACGQVLDSLPPQGPGSIRFRPHPALDAAAASAATRLVGGGGRVWAPAETATAPIAAITAASAAAWAALTESDEQDASGAILAVPG